MFKFDLDPNATYVLPSTFGPDSMALLDMVQKEGISPIVLFVNYRLEDSMDQEQESMEKYCAEHNLRLEILDTNTLSQEGKAENFANWARKARYAFFEQMYKKHNATAILLSHNVNDQIETYLVQKRAAKQPDKYGYQSVSTFRGMIVYRPLLDFTRDELKAYDIENLVPFSEHMDYYEDQHVRDQIHKEVITKFNAIEREQILDQIRAENDEKIRFLHSVGREMETTKSLSIRSIIALSREEFAATILRFISASKRHAHVTTDELEKIRKMCLDPRPNMTFPLGDGLYLAKEYDVLIVDVNPDNLPYQYTLEKPGVLDTPHFHIDFSMGAEDRGIHESDYPLTIRSALPQDAIVLGGSLISVRRLMIDWDFSPKQMELWPIVISQNGKVLHVREKNEPENNYRSVFEIKIS